MVRPGLRLYKDNENFLDIVVMGYHCGYSPVDGSYNTWHGNALCMYKVVENQPEWIILGYLTRNYTNLNLQVLHHNGVWIVKYKETTQEQYNTVETDFTETVGLQTSLYIVSGDGGNTTVNAAGECTFDYFRVSNALEFETEFQNLDNNQIPNAWGLNQLLSTVGLANGQLNAYTIDADGIIYREGVMPENTQKAILEWKGNIASSSWGRTSYTLFEFPNIKIRLSHASYGGGSPNTQNTSVSIFAYDHNLNKIDTILDDDRSSLFIAGDYDYRAWITRDSIGFSAKNISNQTFLFDLKYSMLEEEFVYNLDSIIKLSFGVHTTTNNNNWIDNLRITILTGEPTALDSGLVAHYPFNGNADDESGHGNNGTVNGATLTQDRFGNANSAYSFDGNNDFIQVSNSTDLDVQEITLSLWLNSTQTACVPIAKLYENNPYYTNLSDFRITMNHGPRYIYTDSLSQNHHYITDTLAWNDGVWHHIICTYKEQIGSSVKIYFDGVLQSGSWTEGNGDSKMIFQNVDLFIGKQNLAAPSSCCYVNGFIDDIRIYNRALNPAEIDSLYHEGGWVASNLQVSISMPDTNLNIAPNISIPVYSSMLNTTDGITNYEFNLNYDVQKLQFNNPNISGTLSEAGTINSVDTTSGQVSFTYHTSSALSGSGVLLNLLFTPLQTGNSALSIQNFKMNGIGLSNVQNGSVNITQSYGCD